MRVVTFLILETTQGSSLNAPAMARPTEGPIPPPVEAATHQQFIDSPHCLLSGVWPDRTDGQCYKCQSAANIEQVTAFNIDQFGR